MQGAAGHALVAREQLTHPTRVCPGAKDSYEDLQRREHQRARGQLLHEYSVAVPGQDLHVHVDIQIGGGGVGDPGTELVADVPIGRGDRVGRTG